jgi:transposase
MFYGLDVHKDFIQICELSHDGKRRRDHRIGGTRAEIEAFAAQLGKRDAVVLEATFHTWTIASILQRHAGRVVVANPLQVKAIAHARIKTDKVDAHTLAQRLRLDFVPEVQLPDEKTWAVRQLVSQRRLLGKHCTAAKNTVHSVLHRQLLHYAGSDLFNGPGRRWLAELPLPPTERFLADNALAHLDAIEVRIAALDAKLLEHASVEQDVKLLLTIPGVDVTVAVGLLCFIGDVRRFPTPQSLAAYLGIVPRVRQSAGHCFHGPITKTGNSTARHLAVQAAQTVARSAAPIAASYHRIRRKSGHNVAVTALARKLVVLVWHMLTRREPYRYAPPERARQKLRRVTPGRTRAPAGQVPRTLEAVCIEAGIPLPTPPSRGERRAVASNRRTVTRLRKAHSKGTPS